MAADEKKSVVDGIKFGTDGWRGVIAREFTFANVGRAAGAIAKYLMSSQRKEQAVYTDWGTEYRPAANGVVVGYDLRFLSREFAWHFARLIHDAGIPVAVADAPVPTPAISYAVMERRAAAGIMFTASHNPSIYNGLKVKAEFGGSAPADVTRAIEALLGGDVIEPACTASSIRAVDLRTPFLAQVRKLIDPERLKASPLLVVIDSMYGSAQGYVAQLLKEIDVPYLQIRGSRDPLFGGRGPEPLEHNLIPLRAVLASRRKEPRRMIGVATDGDGDRLGVMDEKGGYINAHEVYALLLRYLVEEKGWRGAVVKSFNLSDMVTQLAEAHGLELYEVPIGFRFAAEMLMKHDVLLAGEESGSYAVRGHIPDRDGVLLSMLFAEIAASMDVPISGLVRRLHEDLGLHVYRRNDMVVENRIEVVERLREAPPDRFANRPVRAVETLDGVKLRFDKGWLLFRASGTEPILRLYCEMGSKRDVDLMLAEAERLARGDLTLW
ncbi:phosphoglucomutase/phosphomannomutase family protein [Candidatus Bipolaricaulota bacterium]|nr:phosphoglucomutase/phosphomannomutase family protein [Candidatus Bipolaricaulota bacterium]